MKSRDGQSQRRAEKKKEDQRRKIQKKEDPGVQTGRKVAVHCVFPMICGSGGSKSRLAKAAGAEPCGQVRDEKSHAASEKAKSTSRSEHFWKLRCRKSACRCGAKHISKSKCTKHTRFGALLEVEMSKKCTPLWREAHFEVKMYKAHHAPKKCTLCAAKHMSKSRVQKTDGYRPLLDGQMSFRVAGERDCDI